MVQVDGNFSTQDSQLDWLSELPDFLLPFRPEHIEGYTKRAHELREKFSTLYVIGLGGSSLGAKAICSYLKLEQVVFFDNLPMDPKRISDPQGHYLAISKSGKTLETLAMINMICEEIGTENLNHKFTVITDPTDSPLRSWAKENNITTLDHISEIGGRFSVFSNVGMLPLAFATDDYQEILKAKDFCSENKDLVYKCTDIILRSFEEKKSTIILWPYKRHVTPFAEWLQQLWTESLGKIPEKPTTITVAHGSKDQHSILQEIATCYHNKMAIFLNDATPASIKPKNQFTECNFLNFEQEELVTTLCESNYEALTKVGCQCYRFTLKNTAEGLGQLMFAWLLAIPLAAKKLGINAFGQPAVELSKSIARDKLNKA